MKVAQRFGTEPRQTFTTYCKDTLLNICVRAVVLNVCHRGFLCREIFPYLVVVIGLENVLVLTKSVVSTPVDLEVKLRIAQGSFCVCHDSC